MALKDTGTKNKLSMKILMILDHEFPPDIRVENEIEALTKAGHEVHVACYTMENRPSKENIGGFVIHRKSISRFIYKTSVGALKFPFYFNFWRSFITQLFKKEHFNAIHVHDLPLARIGYEFAGKHGCRFTLDLHENWPALLRVATHTQSFLGKILSSNRQWEAYEQDYCQKADHVIVVVEEAKERLITKGIPRERISIVSNTLNFQHFEVPSTKPDDKFFTLLYAGGINKHRGLQYIINGLSLLKNTTKPIRLLILGSGSYTTTLKELARSLGVDHMIEFTGWKNYKEMQDYFGRADICLIPHIKNDHTDSTIPHKLFQHMYAGKPTIASNCIPIKRIIEETNCGLVYVYNQPEDFAEKVSLLEESPELYNTFKENGIKAVKEKYNWNIDQQKLIDIYGREKR